MQRIVVLIAFLSMLLVVAGIWWTKTSSQDVPRSSHLEGVDVAHYQGRIDWDALAGDETAFAYIKATEGTSVVDPRFAENWRGARRAGVLRGAYHYFSPCQYGRDQAVHFLSIVPATLGDLPPAIDAESLSACSEGPAISDISGEIIDFMRFIESERGVRPFIYTNRRFYERHFDERFESESFWLSSFGDEPDFGPRNWVFWQYAEDGRRRGISGPVDLNVFAGDMDDLRGLTVP